MIMEEIKQLLEISQKLKEKFSHLNKQFSLDGKLVGDIGEVLAAEKFNLDLYPENTEVYDGVQKATGKKVQIKASFKGYFQFPFGENKIPDYYLAVIIDEDGKLNEVYNGTGRFVYDNYVVEKKLKPYKNSYYTLSKGFLQKLNDKVNEYERINEMV